MVTVEGVLLALFVLLPGAYARVTALETTPIPWAAAYRSQLQELVETLLYSVAVSIIAGLVVATVSTAYFGGHAHMQLLADIGVQRYFESSPVSALAYLVIYFGVGLLVAELVGTTQLLTRLRAFFVTFLGYGREGWVRTPVMVWAIDQIRAAEVPAVAARVLLPDGVAYTGLLAQWPVLGDDVRSKDIVLAKAARWELATGTRTALGADDFVLLNTADAVAFELGPYERPARRASTRTWTAWVRLIMWTGGALFVLTTLGSLFLCRPDDDITRLLLVPTCAALALMILGLTRMWLRDQYRWDSDYVQRLWFAAGAAMAVGAIAGGLRWAPALVALGLGVGTAAMVSLLINARVVPLPKLSSDNEPDNTAATTTG